MSKLTIRSNQFFVILMGQNNILQQFLKAGQVWID